MKRGFAKTAAIIATAIVLSSAAGSSAQAADIIDDWANVKAPPPPALKPVTVDPKTTALLLLDFLPGVYCSGKPHCVAQLPALKQLLAEARASGTMVVFSVAGDLGPGDILKEVAPLPNEPWVKSAGDKFLNTNLEKILKDKGIQTVIVAGTAANGSALYTASAAGLRGFKVVVPVDGLSALDPYAEQLTVWQLANAPRLSASVTLTRSTMIKF
jgi:nicotinamidase-related amidase